MLETYWNRVKNKVPIYFSAGLIEKANFYYKLFVNWTNENIKANYLTENMFNFKNITSFDKSLMRANTPMVLFATPGKICINYIMLIILFLILFSICFLYFSKKF